MTDPTEGRYALGALDMVNNGNYLVPQILRGDSREPYLGKPPLFFWATAAAIKSFGTSEWSVRLPSFICFLLVSLIVAVFGRTVRDWALGLSCSLVWCSSLLPFFLSGTVSFDPLLTFFVSSLMLIAYQLLRDRTVVISEKATVSVLRWARFWRIIFWLLAGAGVLVKGPVIVLYVAAPIFFFCCLRGSLKSSFSKLGVFYGPLIAALVFMPWFIFAEQSNPGFVKYFLFSENFKRFLVKDYGDRYGTGHEYPYGFSLVFLFIGAFPWTFAALGSLRSISLEGWKNFQHRLQNEEELGFSICWALTAPVILIFARQLHPGYILPALPGLSILIVLFFGADTITSLLRKVNRYIFPIVTLVALFALYENLLGLNIFCGVALVAALILISVMLQLMKVGMPQSAFFVTILFSVVLVGAGQFVNQSSSSQQILKCIVKNSAKDQTLKVALIEVKQYAAYFYAESWQTELGRPLDISYVDMDDLPTGLPTNIVVKASKLKDLKIPPEYLSVAKLGRFLWLSNNPAAQAKISCN